MCTGKFIKLNTEYEDVVNLSHVINIWKESNSDIYEGLDDVSYYSIMFMTISGECYAHYGNKEVNDKDYNEEKYRRIRDNDFNKILEFLKRGE